MSFLFLSIALDGHRLRVTFVSSRKTNRSLITGLQTKLISERCRKTSLVIIHPRGNTFCNAALAEVRWFLSDGRPMGSRSSKPESWYDKGRSARDRRKLFETDGFYPLLSLSGHPSRAAVELSASSSAAEWYSAFLKCRTSPVIWVDVRCQLVNSPSFGEWVPVRDTKTQSAFSF